jgi:hypothetical protein
MNPRTALNIVTEIVLNAERRKPTANPKDADARLARIYECVLDLENLGEDVVAWLSPHLSHHDANVRCLIASLMLQYNDNRAIAELERLAQAFGLSEFADMVAKYTLSEWRAGRLPPLNKALENLKKT